MQAKRLCVTIAVLFNFLLLSLSRAQGNRPIDFPDTALRAKIAGALGKGRDATITAADMLALTVLHAPNANIRNLTGLEHAHNLKELDLSGEYIEGEGNINSNVITDLAPLSALTQLNALDLSETGISDISDLSGLTQLIELYLSNNTLREIAPLRGLTQLTGLYLSNNTLREIAPLKALTQLKSLYLVSNAISDISALKELRHLRQLHLSSNAISDISALEGLTQLTGLYLSNNTLREIAPLKALTQLRSLHLGNNAIRDISALGGLTQLTQLRLGNNAISDLSALEGLTQLTGLYLSNNTLREIAPLKALTQLRILNLSWNAISDVSPLAELNLPGTAWNTTGLHLKGNPLSYVSLNTHIPAMQARGVEVQFNARIPKTLLRTSDAAQQGSVNATLPLPFVVEVRDEKHHAFAGVPVMFRITAGSGKLSATTTATDATGQAKAHLTLGRTPGTTTVHVTAAEISQSVQFTATAILRSSPVMIRDANLHARITETLGKPLEETLTAADMLRLTTLMANRIDVLDLEGLQHAAYLTTLSLANNKISNVAPLAGLHRLKTLDLRNNRISDISPLVGLAQWKAPKDWHALNLQGNPLSDAAIETHIPVLQTAGVNVDFHSRTQQTHQVRLIYFLPRGQQPQPDINLQMDRLIKDVQRFYAEQMEAHGFGRKTFQLETDTHGNTVVYYINGKFDDVYYHDESDIVWREIVEQFDTSKNIYFTALDISTEVISIGSACGVAGGSTDSGNVLIPASGGCFNFETAAHELGHAFGLQHDFRDDTYIMSYGPGQNNISQCTAEWLDVQRAFNPSQTTANKHNERATIEMLPPSFVAPPNTIRFRFEVSDPEGLHQVQLLTPTLHGPAKGFAELVNHTELNGAPNDTVEFVTTVLGPTNEAVSLQVIDKHGNMSWSDEYSVDVASLLPPSEVVSIPDPNLAAAVQQEVGNSITTHTILNLAHLDARNRGITNLTGLEHAHNLKTLVLSGEYIEDEGNINSNVITDLAPLSALTQLNALDLSETGISDISPLAGLTQLNALDLSETGISDISDLSGLTQLTGLYLSNNTLREIAPLKALTQLKSLYLVSNAISDISALKELTHLRQLHLSSNAISDLSALEGLTQLTGLYLSNNTLRDISALKELTHLRQLHLVSNAISDISVLKELTHLRQLRLSNNAISDLSALEGLTQLTELYLWGNTIQDVSALKELTQLRILNLSWNAISDVSPLAELNLPGTAWNTTGLHLKGNPLSYVSLNTHIPAMQAKGIKVSYDLDLAPITGPWLWMIVPTEPGRAGKHAVDVDSLAAASAGAVTEAEIAANGAKAGDTVSDYAWTLGKIDRRGGDNINDLLNNIGMAQGDIDDHSSYALITLESVTVQSDVTMRVGSDDAIKVWLNGEVVHNYPINRGASDFQDDFTVDLEKGDNLLLVKVSERDGGWSMFVGIEADVNAVYKRPPHTVLLVDVNKDGIVNIQDLVLVSSNLGKTGQSRADVNGDGVVNIQDLVMVAGSLGEAAAAAPTLRASDLEGFTAVEIQELLTQARQLVLTDPVYLRGIAVLEQLLALLLPKETALLPNYPNPFNPETWIPYQLVKSAEVTLRIYAVNGTLVRTLTLGHQSAGKYQSRSRAAYWNGRNEHGECVASGIYFYTLTAEDFVATRKMLIRR